MTLPADHDWRSLAACSDKGWDLFFPAVEEGPKAQRAKLVCRYCSVRQECLAEALGADVRYGIWGGLSTAERRRGARAA
ncbi:MAG: WhiB family transcriptional regulator [Acidimicrobiia bacterium]